MAVSLTPHRWTLDEFLLAWEAGAVDTRVELLDGEVWDVPIGPWHGEVTANICRALPNKRFRITQGSLPAGESLPLPDCSVLRRAAKPVEQLSARMLRWASVDVLLVVEVSDETVEYDLGRKAVLYAQAGFAHYWTVTRDGIYAHSAPGRSGYAMRILHPAGDRITVPYVDATLDVAELITI